MKRFQSFKRLCEYYKDLNVDREIAFLNGIESLVYSDMRDRYIKICFDPKNEKQMNLIETFKVMAERITNNIGVNIEINKQTTI